MDIREIEGIISFLEKRDLIKQYKKAKYNFENNNFKIENLVSILELAVSKLNINTISGMAKSEGKTPRGIRVSNCYRKTLIGKQKFAIKGLDDVNFPF